MKCTPFTPNVAAVARQRCLEQIASTHERISLQHTGQRDILSTASLAALFHGSGSNHDTPLVSSSLSQYEAILQSLDPQQWSPNALPATELRIAVRETTRSTMLFRATSPPLVSQLTRMLIERERVWTLLACFIAAGRVLPGRLETAVFTALGAARANPVSLLWDLGGSAREAVWLDSIARAVQRQGGGGGANGGGDNALLRGLVGRWQDAGDAATNQRRAYVPTQALHVPTFVDEEGRVYACPLEPTTHSSSSGFSVVCWLEAGASQRGQSRPRGAQFQPPQTPTHESALRNTHPATLLAVDRSATFGRTPWWGCQLPDPPPTPGLVTLVANPYLWPSERVLVTVRHVEIPWTPRGKRTTSRFDSARYRVAVTRRLLEP